MNRFKEYKQVGRRLLPNYIDATAFEDPAKLAIIQTISFDPLLKFEVTYRDLSNIINRLAWWIAESLHGKARGVTIAYLGASDARHLLLALAAVKAGSRLLQLSPRNSVAIHEHLIKATESPTILYDSSFSAIATEIATLQSIDAVQVPDLEYLFLDRSLANEYPYSDTFEDASDKTLVVFHTSGSTGMPKTVTSTHAAMASTDNLRTLYSEKTHRVSTHRVIESAHTIYNGCPLFHAAGFDAGIFMLLSGCVVVIGPPNQPSSPQMFKEVLHMTRLEGALLPPLVINQIAQEPAMVEEAAKLKFITYGGGSASQEAGNILSQRTQMLDILGSSECSLIGCYMTEQENWDWFHFAEHEMGITWEAADDSDAPEFFEMVLHRRDLPQRQAVFANLPDVDVWRTKDIFRRHPTIPYYYKYQSRKDDVIVFSTGEKTNPINVEAAVTSISGVKASLVVGHQRPYPILLVELEASANSDDALPAIHQALEDLNKQTMKYAQIHRGDILIVPPEKPFVRTPKGTINRSQTNKLYEAEIEAQYTSATEIPDHEVQVQLDPTNDETLTRSIANMVGNLTEVKCLGPEDDFFASGLDSRQVQILAATLARALPGKDILFLRNAVYMNPTASRLVQHIRQNTEEDLSKTLDDLFTKYSSMLPQPPKPKVVNLTEKHHVLITGTTGFVGSTIFQTLLQRPDVTEITCINRRVPDTKFSSTAKMINNLKADLSQPLFNLPEDLYQHLAATVTEIIHCQWPVTFNLPLSLFEPQIAGIANLVKLAYDSPQDTRIIFLSSVATIQGWDQHTPVPEEALNSLKYAQGGYGQSKMLASKLLDTAAEASGIPCAVCRVGQVAGPVTEGCQGVWPERDWFPTLLRASRIMGVLPASLGKFNDVDWIPVDSLSKGLVELALDLDLDVEDGNGNEGAGAAYFHFTNPSVSSYADLVPTIAHCLNGTSDRDIEVVDTLAEWIERLSSWTPPTNNPTDPGDQDVESTMTAATALLEFYQGLASDLDQPNAMLGTANTVERIPSLRDAGAVNERWMGLWMDQWGF